MAATLRDVAVHAGVSIKTASNAINGYVEVSDETRRRVKEAVRALGYRPNQIARALRGARGGLPTLVVPDDDQLGDLAAKVVQAAADQGCRVITSHSEAGTDELCLLVLTSPSYATQGAGGATWLHRRRPG